MNTFVGTAAYISPELLSRSETNPKRYELPPLDEQKLITILAPIFGP